VDSPLGSQLAGGSGGAPGSSGAGSSGVGGASGSTTGAAGSTQPSSVVGSSGAYVCAASSADPYAGCPATLAGATQGEPCALPDGTVCDYQSTDGWQSCSCLSTIAGNRWSCAGSTAGGDCPLDRPAPGSTCNHGDYGRSCVYLRSLACTCPADRNAAERRSIVCTCDAAAQAWGCENIGGGGASGSDAAGGSGGSGGVGGSGGAGGSFDESPCYGTGVTLPAPPVDESKIISALTDDEAATWCNWYVENNRGPGPLPPSSPPAYDAQGFPTGWGFTYCGEGGDSTTTCFSAVPVAYCEKLLRLGPCDAPLKALDDCYLTMVNYCEEVGGGCAPLASYPGCAQTVVQLAPPATTPRFSCPVPVH
jgi:hypothetical protein